MLDYQKRVVEEKKQLDEKIKKLKGFIGSPGFQEVDSDEQDRLCDQESIMVEYANILNDRIDAFPK